MISREYGKLVFGCDSCGATRSFYADDPFDQAWSILKRQGWRARKLDSDFWVHSCPDCDEDQGRK